MKSSKDITIIKVSGNFEEDGLKLKQIRESMKLTQEKFAKDLEIPQSSIAMIEKGQRAVNSTIKYKLLQKHKIDWDAPQQNQNTEVSYASENLVPVFFFKDAKAAAGFGITIPNNSDQEKYCFDRRWLKNILGVDPKNVFLIQASGDSMDSGLNKSDDIKDGDLLMIDSSYKEVINNKVFVFQQNNNLRVKKIKIDMSGTQYLISNNSKYAPEEIKKDTQIVGKVVWNGSKENI